MILTMEQLGIEIEVQHHEVATAGQAEIDMRFDTLLVMADKLMLYKYIVKNVARRRIHGDLHAEAALPGQRLGHALPPVTVARRQPVVLRRRVRRPLGHRPLVHRWTVQARKSGARIRSSDHQLVQATRSRDTRHRSTWSTRSGTVLQRVGSRSTRRARRRSGSSSGVPTLRATRTSPSRPC